MKGLCLRVYTARLLVQLGEADRGFLSFVAGAEGECWGHQRDFHAVELLWGEHGPSSCRQGHVDCEMHFPLAVRGV